jgi:hypothetical protein
MGDGMNAYDTETESVALGIRPRGVENLQVMDSDRGTVRRRLWLCLNIM